MAGEPEEGIIELFTGFTGLARTNAIRWLKVYRNPSGTFDIVADYLVIHQANNNDSNNASNAWLDSGMAPLPPPPKPPQKDVYSENDFHSDRAGSGPQTQMEASFGPQPQTLSPSVFNNAVPPTRPSSRVSNSRSGQVYGPENNPNLQGGMTYEQQLKRATEMSLNDSKTFPGQESGIAYGNQHFGPAKNEHYDSSQWAMTIPEPHTQEILLSPDPPDRERMAGTPAFLKPSSTNPSLPALVKILHEIPIAREALLNRTYALADYGREPDWWDGTSIKALRVVNVDDDQQLAASDDFIYETQRLMAFLDDTERAYGSVDALASMQTAFSISDGPAADFFLAWNKATEASASDSSLATFFYSRGCQRPIGETEPTSEKKFASLQVDVDVATAGQDKSLYDAIDELIWTGFGAGETFLDRLGDVFTMEVTNKISGNGGLGVSIPPIWYADRYLESAIPEAKQMMARKEAIAAHSSDADEVQKRMLSYTNPNGVELSAMDLVTKAAEYLQQTLALKDASEAGHSRNTGVPFESLANALEELNNVNARVSDRMKGFEEIKASISDRLKEASNYYKEPSDVANQPPSRKYTLRGVSSNPHTVYTLEKNRPEDEDDLLSSSAQDWQWWKNEYIASSSTPVKTTKVSEAEVLTSASTESNRALLVYASERAVSYKAQELPPQLKNFVRADNLAFEAELQSFRAQQQTVFRDDYGSISSPSKRKAASDSDLEVEYERSPRQRSDDDMESQDSSPFDPHPLKDDSESEEEGRELWDMGRPPPPRMRELAPKPAVVSSSIEPEMQESGGSGGGLLKGVGQRYELGSYEPEINMEDVELGEEKDDGRGRRT